MYVSVDIKPKNGTRTPADVNDHVLTYAKDSTVSEGDSVFFQLGYSTVYRATYSLKLNNKDITQPNRFTMADGSTIEIFFSYRVPGK